MLLELNDVSKSFGGVAALTGISFGVKQGEVFGVKTDDPSEPFLQSI